MKPRLDHTIIDARSPEESARFMSEVFGFAEPTEFGHFVQVETGNGVNLDYARADPAAAIPARHLAFLVTEREFDEIFGRVRRRGLDHWPTPQRSNEGQINHNDGGRGVYFCDPSGHLLEIITRPYGSGPNGE